MKVSQGAFAPWDFYVHYRCTLPCTLHSGILCFQVELYGTFEDWLRVGETNVDR